jgi:hypothetical protein
VLDDESLDAGVDVDKEGAMVWRERFWPTNEEEEEDDEEDADEEDADAIVCNAVRRCSRSASSFGNIHTL